VSDTTTERPAPRPARSPDQIEAEIARTRESLADDIDVLQERLSPANLMQRAKARVVGVFQRPDGSLDPVRTGIAVGVGVVLVVYLVRRRNL
jgi:hypothetical protein